jgi:preprotein translocase subunit YajC
MKDLIFASVVPDWLILTGKIVSALIVIFVFFVFCLMKANIKEHEKKDDTIEPGDF